MADIIPFPRPRAADAVATLRGGIARLDALSATLGECHASLSDKQATLGALKDCLLVQASQSYAIGALAQAVEAAVAAGDSVAMAALQAEIALLRHPDADRDPACRRVDAAD